MMALFASAFALGLLFNAAPGAVFAETVRQGVRGGFAPAFAVQVGSLVGDALWAVLGMAGVGLLLRADMLRIPVGIAGATYLLWLARDAWKAANAEFSVSDDAAPAPTLKALRFGMAISLTNPHNVAYWAALGSALGAVGIHNPTQTDYAVFFAGFMASSLVWCVLCAALVARLFRSAGSRWVKVTYRLCAVALMTLAASSLRDLFNEAPNIKMWIASPALSAPPN